MKDLRDCWALALVVFALVPDCVQAAQGVTVQGPDGSQATVSGGALKVNTGGGSPSTPGFTTDVNASSTVSNNGAVQGVVAMTVGTTYAAQRGVGATCTVAGNMAVTFPDASILTVPVAVGFQSFQFAVTAINISGTTATCTYSSLK